MEKQEPRFVSTFIKVIDWSCGLSTISIFFIMVMGTFDALASKILGIGIPETVTMTAQTHVIISAVPLAFSTLMRGHIDIDLVERNFSPQARRIVEFFGDMLGLLISVFIAWRGTVSLISAIAEGTGRGVVFVVPDWPFLIVLVYGYLMMSISFGIRGWRKWQGPLSEEQSSGFEITSQ